MDTKELPDWVALSVSSPQERLSKRCKSNESGVVDVLQKLSLVESQSSFLPTAFPSFLLNQRIGEDTNTALTRILSVGNERELDERQLSWLHQQVQHILAQNNHVPTESRYLKCTPLHLAIRNYGSFQSLLMTLLDTDQKHGYPMLSKRDDKGELAIHTVCRMGVPIETIRLLLRHMAIMTPNLSQLIGSPNNRGWTPFDLAWMRHLESSSHEVLSTLQNCHGEAEKRVDELFANLLSEMVDHTLNSEHTESAVVSISPLMQVLASLIDACVDNTATKDNADNQRFERFLIHKVFQVLQSSNEPLLPLPLIQLMLFQYPDQASLADENGKLPLHYALKIQPRNIKTQLHANGIAKSDYKLYVQEILRKNPSACLLKDSAGRLPIHYSLENQHNDGGDENYDAIVQDIVLECPAAVEMEDPLSLLYPFMMAATNCNVSLDTVYRMLRFHPQCLPSSHSYEITVHS